ncbi:MAG: hypothetical protein KDG50_04240 [Chromatiales bacterium]|nr:hypothetical protein [Chromatiales bacterium]
MHATTEASTEPETSHGFRELYRGELTAARGWDDLARLWARVRERDGWYVYALAESTPHTPATAADLDRFLTELDALLRDEHDEPYCGIVYADDLESPNLVKVYDPGNLGKVCGYSTEPIPPGWVLSRVPPEPLAGQSTGRRRRWWQRLFG